MNFILMVEVEDDAIGSFLYRETFRPGARLTETHEETATWNLRIRGPGSQTRVMNKEAPETHQIHKAPSLGCIGSKDSCKEESLGMEIS